MSAPLPSGERRPRDTALLERFPAGPAQRAIQGFAQRHNLSLDGVAFAIALDAQLIGSVMQRRWLPWESADTLAVALGKHPSALWPEWFAQ